MLDTIDLRKAILNALKQQNRSHEWLAQRTAALKGADGKPLADEDMVYRFLRSDSDSSGDVIGAMLDLMKLQVTSEPPPKIEWTDTEPKHQSP